MPFCSAIFCGSIVLPMDLDIFMPFSSMVKPCVITSSYGALPRVAQHSSNDE
jgi:hypothetical protein